MTLLHAVDSFGHGLSHFFHNGLFQLSRKTFSLNYLEVTYDLLLGKLTLSLLVSFLPTSINNSNLFLFPVGSWGNLDLLILTMHPLSGVPAQMAFLWSPEFSSLALAAHCGMSFKDFIGDSAASLEILSWSFKSYPRPTLTTC